LLKQIISRVGIPTPTCALSVYQTLWGESGYLEYIQKARVNFISNIEEDAPTLKVQTLMTQDNQWQCIIRESRYIHRDAKKLHIVTYLLGQSMDEGLPGVFLT